MINVIQGATTKPVSSQKLANLLSKDTGFDGELYIGYPVLATPNGAYPIDALLLSPKKGAVVFNIVEGTTLPEEYREEQDDAANKLEAKLRNHHSLMDGRSFIIPISVVTFAPAVASVKCDSRYPVCTEENLVTYLCRIEDRDYGAYNSLLSVVQSVSNIRTARKKRGLKTDNSRGAKLKQLEDSIANLDNSQSRAVIETVDGVQRIRGLAGSGKTIVLALKAAYLHARHPDWNILGHLRVSLRS